MFFIHVPKTGGSSIERAHGYESNHNGAPREHGFVVLRHRNINELKQHLENNAEEAPKYTFTVVRNVFERIASTYRHYFRDRATPDFMTPETYSYESYIENLQRFHNNDDIEIRNERVYLAENNDVPVANFRHLQPMDWWTEGLWGGCTFLRFETLNEDYKRHISPISGVEELPHFNKAPKRIASIDAAATEFTNSVIAKIFEAEIDRHGMRAPSVKV